MTDDLIKRYGFDDLHIGTVKPNKSSLVERIIKRPPGIFDVDWWKHADDVAHVLEAQAKRIAELEAQREAWMDDAAEWGAKAGELQDKVYGLSLAAHIIEELAHKWAEERDEAREAVKRMAGITAKWAVGDVDDAWDALEDDARAALADPVVKRIVEGE